MCAALYREHNPLLTQVTPAVRMLMIIAPQKFRPRLTEGAHSVKSDDMDRGSRNVNELSKLENATKKTARSNWKICQKENGWKCKVLLGGI